MQNFTPLSALIGGALIGNVLGGKNAMLPGAAVGLGRWRHHLQRHAVGQIPNALLLAEGFVRAGRAGSSRSRGPHRCKREDSAAHSNHNPTAPKDAGSHESPPVR